MERLIHLIWKHRLYPEATLTTTQGIPLSVIDPGIHNIHAGPDFFNAKIRLEGKVWAGNVEIHTAFSDWYRHQHERDGAYNSVILHVAVLNDCPEVLTQNGRRIPQVLLEIPANIKKNYEYLLHADGTLPCFDRLNEVPALYLTDWMNALTIHRLEEKMERISGLLKQTSGDWEEVFYITLARNLGFGVNGDAFERLSKSLPLKYIRKHQDNLFQLESMLFGQAGLLEEDTGDEYYLKMQAEYRFLRNKFSLQPLDGYLFKCLRVRPYNSPYVKIAQLAALLHQHEHFFSSVLDGSAIDQYCNLFTPEVSDYWRCHYYFGALSGKTDKKFGLDTLYILLINTVIPILFAYGKVKKENRLVESALSLLELLPPEKNSIISLFRSAGVVCRNASDTQAIIQLKRAYCERKECLFCRVGYKLLTKPEGESQKIM